MVERRTGQSQDDMSSTTNQSLRLEEGGRRDGEFQKILEEKVLECERGWYEPIYGSLLLIPEAMLLVYVSLLKSN
jgi:hypothetical protein